MGRVTPAKTATPEDREQYIAEAAYYLAEHRSFEGGDPEQDWFEAEDQIDLILAEQDEAKAR